MKITDTNEAYLIFTQEPYEYQSRPTGIGKKHRIFTAETGKHRAAIIIINNTTDTILRRKISDENNVGLEIIYKNLQFYSRSMHFDIKD
jgi:hypothetical protein